MEPTGDLDKSSLVGVSGAEACLEEAEGGREATGDMASIFRTNLCCNIKTQLLLFGPSPFVCLS